MPHTGDGGDRSGRQAWLNGNHDIDETTCPNGQVRKGGLARWPIY